MNPKLPLFQKARNNINFNTRNSSRESFRIFIIPLGFFIGILILFGRLFHVTVVKGAYYQFASENNRIRELTVEGQRGSIFDRHGREIVFTEEVASDEESKASSFERKYMFQESVSHVIGYRQKADKEDFEEDACENKLYLNDTIGRSGIEGLYECHLRQKKGKKLIEVDATEEYLKTISEIDPEKGKDVKLSIDAGLQDYIYNLIDKDKIVTDPSDLNEKHVALVAMKPQTGEVISLLSYPGFDPIVFDKEDNEQINKYIKEKDKPLFNRALYGAYPPGSVFKPIVAAGALEEKAILPTDTITDNGFIEVGGSKFRNWLYTKYGRTDGEVDVYTGLQRSNDIYFYKIGEKMTAEHIKTWSEKFGLGRSTKIDLGDVKGTVPSDFWKRETIGDRWFLGDTYNLSIGQGYLLTTPIQINRAIAAFANDGKICKPQILKLDAYENRLLLDSDKPECTSVGLSEENIEIIREGMRRACAPLGTGWPFFEFKVNGEPMEVGCKTGTAESVSKTSDQTDLPHAWFTIFAPYENPEIVLTVMVENGGEGSNVAAPIAKEYLLKYFE